jgi:hypothetical protein
LAKVRAATDHAVCLPRVEVANRSDLFFEQGVRQLEMLMLVRVGVEQLWTPRADALHIGGVMDGEPSAFVEVTGMAVHVPATGFINVEPDHLFADRTLGHERVEPPSAQELDELNDPYG